MSEKELLDLSSYALIISINTPDLPEVKFDGEDCPFPKYLITKGIVLPLWFADATPEDDINKHLLIQPEQAKAIREFVDKHIIPKNNTYTDLYIHCSAGRSRSAAVAIVLNDYINRFLEDNIDDWHWSSEMGFEKLPMPNPYVAKTLKEELYNG